MSSTPNMTIGQFPQYADLIVRNSLKHTLEVLPQPMRKAPFTLVEKKPGNTGLYVRYKERLDIDQYSSFRAEGAASTQAQVQYGYEKDLVIYTRSKAIAITETMREAGKDSQEINDTINSLTICIPMGIELDLAHRVTFATATSYVDRDGRTVDITVGDGLAPASASHTLTGSSSTYSTIIPNNPVFSKGALAVAEKSMVEGALSNLGYKKRLSMKRCILTTDDPDTCNSVAELLKATADVTSSNSGTFNVYANKYTHIVSELIATDAVGNVDTTKARYWALVAQDASDLHLTILQEPKLSTPADGNNGEDISTGNWNYVVRGMHGICQVTAKGRRYSTPS